MAIPRVRFVRILTIPKPQYGHIAPVLGISDAKNPLKVQIILIGLRDDLHVKRSKFKLHFFGFFLPG